jgi:serine kinase of HPr protein (carbohydrate metabolism regulator)
MMVHATCIACEGRAVLLCGSSGSGKSDLALRLIDGGARLVADDQVALRAEGGRIVASAPESIAGRLEVRGIGIVSVPHVAAAPVALVIDLVSPGTVERVPDAAQRTYLGIALPLVALAPFEASAAAKIRLVLARQAGLMTGNSAPCGPPSGAG